MINLNKNGGIEAPRAQQKMFPSLWWLLVSLLTVGVFILLVKLGFWQLSRGEYKLELESQLVAREAMAPISLSQVMALDEDLLTGVPLEVSVLPSEKPLIYLDNVTYEGRVGYRVLQLMVVQGETAHLLVELGFVRAQQTREHLPAVSTITKPVTLKGKIYQRSENPLSHDLMPERLTSGLRIQNQNLAQLQTELQTQLFDFVLQPDVIPAIELPRIWKPYPMTSSKHFGYAFQWFGLALAYIVLLCLFMKRKQTARKKRNTYSKD